MKKVLDPLNPDEGLLMVTREEWNQLKDQRGYLRALRDIARGEVSGFELQQIAIRALAGDYRRD